MLRAITIDDELPNHLLLKRFIEKGGHVEVVAQFTDPQALLEQYVSIKPDVIFVDIEMPVMNGLEVAEIIMSQYPDLQIVFVTAYSQYAVEAFRVNALDYLLKPIDPKEMKRVINKLISSVHQREIPASTEVHDKAKRCQIHCLGEFKVYGVGSSKHVQWLTSKVEELFAYLIMRPGITVNKTELCDVLWPDSDDEKGLMNLYSTVYRLRKTTVKEGVPIKINSDKNGYQIETEGCDIDYREFERLVHGLEKTNTVLENDSEIEDLMTAERIYQGELFTNQTYLWSAPYSEAINKMYRLLCYRLSGCLMSRNAIEQSVGYLENLLAVFPDEERACIILMDIFKIQNNKPAIEKYYKRYTSYLRDEMNVMPSAEFQKHYDSLFL